MSYLFDVQHDPMDFVMNMAQNMHKYEPQDYIKAHYIQQLEYNEQVHRVPPKIVQNYFCQKTLSNFRQFWKFLAQIW